MPTHTAKELLLQLADMPELIGRTLYTYEGGNIYAGPIERIYIEDKDLLVIECEWIAIKNEDRADEWRELGMNNRLSARAGIGYANGITDGSFQLSLPYIGRAHIDGPNATPLARPKVS